MVLDPFGGEPWEYKLTATLEDLLEKKPKETILALIGGIALGMLSNYFPNIREVYFTSQPALTPEGINYIKGTVKRIAKKYALKVAEYGSLLSQ